MSQQFVFFIIGLPCSGKSSVAQFIAQRYDCVHLSTEQIRASLMKIDQEDDDCDFTLQQQTDVYNKMSNDLHFLLKSGKSVVVDGVYRSIDRRNEIFEIASCYDSVKRVFAYHLTCDENVAIKRLIYRKEQGTVAPAGVKGYSKIKLEFEPVDYSKFVEIDNTYDLDYTINKIVDNIEKRIK